MPRVSTPIASDVRRLRLIRALIELAQVPVATVKEILESLDSDTEPLHEQIGRAHRALTPTRRLTATDEARAAAATQVTELIERWGRIGGQIRSRRSGPG
jgi:DNA-binding transcriptional MerR regulator